MRKAPGVLVALFLLGCKTQAPYEPAADCPKIEYCGQCASRGGCVWCGDPNDGSRGQCVGVGRSERAAPSALAKTPETCAPPPTDTPSATALVENPAGASAVERRLGTEKYRAIRSALMRAFPSARVTDDIIEKVADVLDGPRPPMRDKSPATAPEKPLISRPVREKDHRLYQGNAVHHRMISVEPESRPMQSQFTKSLPIVRVSLPDTLDAENTVISTEIGDVDLAHDHLLGSIDLIAEKYSGAGHLGYRPARVDLLTPARAVGMRFGAIAVYLGYRKASDRGPTFYLLEAGTATGDAKMIYFSPTMKPIASATSYYLPTPFVTMRNTYSGGVTMQAPPNEDEPHTLIVESRVPGGKDPYIRVTVTYVRSRTMDLPLPIELTVNAATRVAAVARAMGVTSTEPLERVLADIAMTLYWIESPHYTPSTAPAGSSSPAEPSRAPGLNPAEGHPPNRTR